MTSIRQKLAEAADGSDRLLWGGAACVSLAALEGGSSLGGRLGELSGRCVLIATRDQLAAAVALIELDGVARRVVICTPDLASADFPSVMATAGIDTIVSDYDVSARMDVPVPLQVVCSFAITPAKIAQEGPRQTEWVLLTSGTTGAPKMVVHTLASLTAPFHARPNVKTNHVWGTFYDIRRYGGLQILLRALLGRASFVLSGPSESADDYLTRLGAHQVTHISGTPSHWRRALMSPFASAIEPRYVRLSGEIADQGILDKLRSFYPHAAVGHAFASTEAGLGFEVNDGLEGFPASLVGASGDVEMKIQDGSLRIRSNRTAARYLGHEDGSVADSEGFVDTGDMLELRRDRYFFLGRRSGVINVGGLKVHPEEVEAVINSHPAVRMSIARSRKNPIVGSVVVADVVLIDGPPKAGTLSESAEFEREILRICRQSLAAHKVPAAIRFVPALEVAAAGKLARQ
jgi:acyl-coenzyme A synthetase/AMP-(fatty) acid ligase